MNSYVFTDTLKHNTFIGTKIKVFRNENKFAKKSRQFCGGGDIRDFLISKLSLIN